MVPWAALAVGIAASVIGRCACSGDGDSSAFVQSDLRLAVRHLASEELRFDSQVIAALDAIKVAADKMTSRTTYWATTLQGPTVMPAETRQQVFGAVAADAMTDAAKEWKVYAAVIKDNVKLLEHAVSSSGAKSTWNADTSLVNLESYVTSISALKDDVLVLAGLTGSEKEEALSKLRGNLGRARQSADAFVGSICQEFDQFLGSVQAFMTMQYPGTFLKAEQRVFKLVDVLSDNTQKLVSAMEQAVRDTGYQLPSKNDVSLVAAGALSGEVAKSVAEGEGYWNASASMVDDIRNGAVQLYLNSLNPTHHQSLDAVMYDWVSFTKVAEPAIARLLLGPMTAIYEPKGRPVLLSRKAKLVESFLDVEAFLQQVVAARSGDKSALASAGSAADKMKADMERELHDLVMEVTEHSAKRPSFCMMMQQHVFDIVDAVGGAAQNVLVAAALATQMPAVTPAAAPAP